jgi:hypothetical protein
MSSIRRLTVASAVHHSGRARLLCRLLSHSVGNSRQNYAKGMSLSPYPVSSLILILTLFLATECPKREFLHALSPLL